MRTGELLRIVCLAMLVPALRPLSAAAVVQADSRPPSVQPSRETSEEEPADDSSALSIEETLGRYQQLLERRPLHAQAFAGLVKHFAELGKMADLVKEYEAKVESLPDNVAIKVVLARLYMRAGQPEKAAELLDRIGPAAEKLGRDESKWLVFKAEVFQKTHRLDQAQSVLDEALSKAKTVSERLRLAEALADLHLAAGDKDQAAEALTRLAREYADNYLHRKRIAEALAQRDLHEQAVAELRAMLPLTEGKSDQRCETLRQLGRSLERLSRTQEAIDAYSEAVNLLAAGHWLRQELHERIVTLYRAGGRLEDLVKYCRAQLERAPEQTGMRVLLADVLTASGDNAGARQTLEEAVQLFPKDRMLSERRVQFLERINEAAAAASEYERILAQQPDDVELYIAYGQFLANHQQLEAARNQWKHVLNSALTDATLAQRLGSLFEPYELLDDAAECYERAVQLSPSRPESYAALARLWFARGEKEKALATLKRMSAAAADDASNQAAVCQVAAGLGLTDEALAAITRACELAPNQADYQTSRADLLIQSGRLDEALRVRREALALLTQPGQLAQAVNILVSLHATAGKLDALKSAEQQRLEDSPHDTLSLILLARAADFDRDFAAARKWLDRLLEIEPAHEEARHQLARLLEATGDVDSAVEAYRKLIDLHPARARQWYQAIADLKLRYDDKGGAVETFARIVQTSPGNATVLKDVAEQLARMGELEKAIDYYEQSLRLQSDRHEIRLQYANTLSEAGRLDDALLAYKAVALQRSDRDSAMEAMTKLHEVAGRIGALDELLDELQAQVEANPENALVAHALAELLIREYEYTRAMELIDLVLRNQSRDAELQLVRGELLRRLAKFDDALETYRRVLRFPDVDRDFVLGEMGKACFEAGRIEQARAFWRQISHKLYAGSLLRNNGLLKDAIEILQEGIRLKPDDYGLHRSLIRTLAAAGKQDEALDAARRLLDLEPENVLNIRDLAKAYLERGNRAAAADVAARLFSAAVAEKKTGGGGGLNAMQASPSASLWMASMQSTWSIYGWSGQGGPARSNLDAAVQFFRENNLLGELQDILTQQLEVQADNALLKLTSAEVFMQLGKPDVALRLYRELETAAVPVEHQEWLGQCAQRDFFRLRQYQLMAAKPALRDARLAQLEPKPDNELTRDELVELAIVRQAQGMTDKAVELMRRALAGDDGSAGVRHGRSATSPSRDTVVLSALVTLLMSGERYRDAEPYVNQLTELIAAERERLTGEMMERARRDFVRGLPLQLQLRVTDDLLRDIAHKWTLGQTFASEYIGMTQTIGYFRARLILATIYAKTERMEQARAIWQELAPKHPADVEGWTMLAGVAQLHDQNDLALSFYGKAMQAARVLAEDPLYQRIYGGSLSQIWFGGQEVIDSTFNRIVGTFASADKLIELYDFLRDTDQVVKARQIARQYDLYEKLKEIYQQRFDEAGTAFRASAEDPLRRSVAYLTAASKLAELYDQTGDWPQAESIYTQYLDDFPDELALLVTLSEAAEKQGEYEQALEWEKRVVACKERLARRTRDWLLREIPMLPAIPQVLGSAEQNRWEWQQRWGRNAWWGGSGNKPLELWPSWIRIAELHLARDNVIAAGNALERAITAAGSDRENVAKQILTLIKQRQLGGKLLSVMRSLAVQLPTDEATQLAFSESLEANDRQPAAVEVYRRIVRRGVSDIGTLTRVKQRLAELVPAPASEELTLASLEAEVAADPSDAGNKLRLAKGYYYSLDIEKALETASAVMEIAPHLEGLHDLLIEIYTVKGDTERIIEALRTKIQRVSDANEKSAARRRLANELLARGETEAALEVLKELADPKNPGSYETLGMLLHYFGRHDEAIEQFEKASRSQQANMWGGAGRGETMQVRARVLKGDVAGAADKLLEAVDQQARQMVQYGGMMGAWTAFNDMESRYFQPFLPLLVLEPKLADEVLTRLTARHAEKPDDPQATKLLYQFSQTIGRPEQAEKLLEEMAGRDVGDQTLVTRLIDRAIERKEFEKAIKLAEKFIVDQPKPTVPPGIPPQLVGMLSVMTPRNMMLCKLGDVYWKMEQRDKAFEYYRQIRDEKIDESRIAYAAICMLRDRREEAEKLVEAALTDQQVKSPGLLQFRAVLGALAENSAALFADLARSIEISAGTSASPFDYGERGVGPPLLAQVAQRTNQLDHFVEFMNQRIQKNPNQWEDYNALAGALYDAGRVVDALEVLERALKVKAIRRDALQKKIEWREGFASAEELIPLYQELIEISEKQTKSSGAGSMLSRIFGGGQPQPEQQIQTQPLRNRLGDLLWQAGQKEKAEAVWMERMDAKSAQTQVTIGQRLLEKKDYDRAAEFFRKALELQPDNLAAHRTLADLAYHSGDWEAALGHMREVFVHQYATLAAGPQPQRQVYSPWGEADEDSATQRWENISEDRVRAAELARDPRVIEKLQHASTPEELDTRLMLAAMTGNWPKVERELDERLKTQPYDPMLWTLRAVAQERGGQWPEAIEAWEMVRRLKQTTIAKHREQLKLVLAGKQVKEAAAGEKEVKDPNAAVTPGFNPATYYPNYDYYNNRQADQDTQRLASLYLKLGQFQQAERLLLVSQQANMRWVLPGLASLTWKQGLRERALELLRLAVTTADDTQMLPQYASMLAEAGNVEAATALLVQAYRCQRQEQSNNPMAMMYGGGMGGEREQDFENAQEQMYSTALYDLLKTSGALDSTLTRLQEQWKQTPEDGRIARLVLGLLTRDRRWPEALTALATFRSAASERSDETALTNQLFRIQVQLHDWDAALGTLQELRTQLPEAATRWRMNEAFVRLMQQDRTAAVAAIDPDLSGPALPEAGSGTPQIAAALAAAQEYERLIAYLKKEYDRGVLDDSGCLLLIRLYELVGKWSDAIVLSLQRLWDKPEVLTAEHPAYRELVASVQAARSARQNLPGEPSRPEDGPMIPMAADGAAAGKAAFEKLVAEQPDNVNARRGLIFSAEMSGDAALAASAGEQLLTWLQTRQQEVWHAPRRGPLGEQARAYIEQMKSGALNTTAALGASLSFSSMIQQFFGSESADSTNTKHYAIWQAYARRQPDLLVWAGQAERAAALLESCAAHEEAKQYKDAPDSRRGYSYYTSGYGAVRYAYPQNWNGQQAGMFDRDGPHAARAALGRHHLFAPLLADFAQLGSRVPATEWSALADALAAAGRTDEAQRWRRRAADASLLELRAGDAPNFGTLDDFRWSWYRGADWQERNRLRGALHIKFPAPDDEEDPQHVEKSKPRAGGLLEWACADREIEAQLTALTQTLGPGFAEGHTVSQAIEFYRQTQQPQRIIELLDRVLDFESLIRSPRLGAYLAACFEVRERERAERILDAVLKLNSSMENDVQVARLVLLRLRGEDSAAETLEHELLARCRRERDNPARLEERLVDGLDAASSRYPQALWSSGPFFQQMRRAAPIDMSHVTTMSSLALSLGVPYTPDVEESDLTLRRIAGAYADCRLFAHAARLLDSELAAEAARMQPRERARMLAEKAGWLAQAGQQEAARKVAEEVEKFWLTAARADQADPVPAAELVNLYESKAYGPEFARALDGLARARQLNPGFDPYSQKEARYLFELGRYDDAWRLYESALIQGAELSPEQLYRAGLSGAKAGASERALQILRLALWRTPQHALASAAREVIHE
ncbi:MAG TPA: tetratricopeptide repeat protein [Phycisphaerae bacterium]